MSDTNLEFPEGYHALLDNANNYHAILDNANNYHARLGIPQRNVLLGSTEDFHTDLRTPEGQDYDPHN